MFPLEGILNGMTSSPDPPFVLRIFVATHCVQSIRVEEVRNAVLQELPNVRVEIINLDEFPECAPDAVFSVPTYLLNGRVISLGNPGPDFVGQLRAMLGPANPYNTQP